MDLGSRAIPQHTGVNSSNDNLTVQIIMQEITKSLLLEHHAGRTTLLQVRLIEDWLKDPKNEAIYYQTLFEWESAHPQYIPDTTAGLEKYRQYMDEPIPTSATASLPTPRLGLRLLSPWLVAASVTLLIGLATWLLREPIVYKTYVTDYGQIEQIQLADGSQVVLNANSSLRVPRIVFGYNLSGRNERTAFLTGEAKFSVIHTRDNRRFVVRTGRQVDVEVLGTEFLVFNRERATKVMLMKGRVKLHCQHPNEAAQQLIMRPGEAVTVYDAGKLSVNAVARPADQVAWTEHRFVFDDTPLREIGYLIKENYGLDVAIKGSKLAERKLTGTFEAASADELLNVLKELMDVNVVRQRNRVIISEKN